VQLAAAFCLDDAAHVIFRATESASQTNPKDSKYAIHGLRANADQSSDGSFASAFEESQSFISCELRHTLFQFVSGLERDSFSADFTEHPTDFGHA
jgi:hypothetical protein